MKRTRVAITVLSLVLTCAAAWHAARGDHAAQTASVPDTVVPAVAPAASSTIPETAIAYAVARVVDGDTFKVARGTTTDTVRLIGVDTPETVKPRTAVQCFGAEASAEAHRLLDGRTVYLVGDPTQDARDRYGRLLAYAYRDDGLLINRALIESGYGHEYTYRVPYQQQASFRAAEREARESQRGLWSPTTCTPVTSST